MFQGKNQRAAQRPEGEQFAFTHEEIDLISECIQRTEDYYKGLLLLSQDWNAEQNEYRIAAIKVKLNMLDDLQRRTTYIGQAETYQ